VIVQPARDLEQRAAADAARLTLARVALDAARDELDRYDLDSAAGDAHLAGQLLEVVAANETAGTLPGLPLGRAS
jgi:hypothetical protein